LILIIFIFPEEASNSFIDGITDNGLRKLCKFGLYSRSPSA